MKNSFTIYNLSQFLFQLCTSLFLDRATHLGLALIVKLLALCDPELELYSPILPINTSYDERHTLLRDLFYELFDLTFVE